MAQKDLAQEVLDMRDSVDKAKSKYNQLKGERDGALKQMDADFDVNSLSSAKKKLKQLQKERREAEDVLEGLVEEFEDKYGRFEGEDSRN